MAKKSPKEAFFAAVPPAKTTTLILEGQNVTIRAMNVGQRIDFETSAAGKSSSEVALLAVVSSVVDADGDLIFTADDIPQLKTLPPDYILPIMKTVLKTNSLTDEDVGDLAKN